MGEEPIYIIDTKETATTNKVKPWSTSWKTFTFINFKVFDELWIIVQKIKDKTSENYLFWFYKNDPYQKTILTQSTNKWWGDQVTFLRIPDMMLVTIMMLPLASVLLTPASGLVIPETRGQASGAEPDPMCPMVGLDCIFHDIERAYNSA